jgi:hypothetical protein
VPPEQQLPPPPPPPPPPSPPPSPPPPAGNVAIVLNLSTRLLRSFVTSTTISYTSIVRARHG